MIPSGQSEEKSVSYQILISKNIDKKVMLLMGLTSFFCGAAVMAIEVLGSRVIGPFFGASLYVWTSLITVTLIALACGYWVGGIFSDRDNHRRNWLFGIIALAGIAILMIPFIKVIVIKLALHMGLRSGSLIAAGVLFGPALFLLGMVSPFVIRIAAQEISGIGRTVGIFSSISTAGSFVGTIFTGFVLIAYFPIDRIFMVIGGSLLVLAVICEFLFRKSAFVLPLLILTCIIPATGDLKTKTLQDGTLLKRIFSKDTFYGNMQVHDYSHGEQHTRELVVDATIQGGIDIATGQSVYEYPYFLQFIPRSINPLGKECLVIGLGPGVVPVWFERHGVRTDVVDINPEIITVANRFFGFSVSGKTYAEDARYFLNRTTKQYDYIIIDVFNGENTPFHVLSYEALQTVKSHLASGGVLAVNMVGTLHGDTFMTASLVKTMKTVFRTVDIYPVFKVGTQNNIGNIELFAYNHEPFTMNRQTIASFPIHPMAAAARELMITRFTFPPDTPAMILTDSYNPIDIFDIRAKEIIRRRIIESSDLDFLMS